MPEGILPRSLQKYSLSAELFREIDAFGTNHPVLIVRVPPFPPWDAGASFKGCTLLIPFQEPSNVGAVIRSAAAFGVTNLVRAEGGCPSLSLQIYEGWRKRSVSGSLFSKDRPFWNWAVLHRRSSPLLLREKTSANSAFLRASAFCPALKARDFLRNSVT